MMNWRELRRKPPWPIRDVTWQLVAEFESRSGYVGFVVGKVAVGQFSSNTSVFPPNFHSIECSTFSIYYPGLVQ
jgi:hypothetical protein